MSHLFTTPGQQGGLYLKANEARIQPAWWQPPIFITARNSYQNKFWPRTGLVGGSIGAAYGEYIEADWHIEPDLTRGARSMFGIAGITRDVYGSPEPFCTVKLFKTASDELVYQITSDGDGAFVVYTPHLVDPHYIVAFKAGSPDIAGASDNNLVGV